MSDSKYFVLVNHQKNDKFIPLLNEDNFTIRLFDTVKEATAYAGSTSMGEVFGFGVYEIGDSAYSR